MTPAQVLILAFAFSFVVEGGVEYFIGKPMEKSEKLAPHTWMLMYVAPLVAGGLAYYYRLDLVALIQQLADGLASSNIAAPVEPTPIGIILTGVVVGRGSNYLHQFISKFIPTK